MLKTIEYIPESGADKGKVFVITAMSAFKGDKWGRRAIKAVKRSADCIADASLNEIAGIAGLAGVGDKLYAYLSDEKDDEMLNELLECCLIKRDPGNPMVQPTKILEIDLEDPTTLPLLRNEAFKINLGFLKAGILQNFPVISAVVEIVREAQGNNEKS